MKEKKFVFYLIIYCTCCTHNYDLVAAISADCDPLSGPMQIKYYGYPFENHKVITEDGYILAMHRIPHGKNNSNDTNKPVVLLVHGLLGSSANFVATGPKRAIAFLLADAGYDVWIGNTRGNRHSRHHATLDPDKDEVFWQFSWHEVGVYDLPAKIDYVLEKTRQTQIFYIGHSQGTTVFYVLASERPEYNQKIKLMVSLAPTAFMTEVQPNSFVGLLIKHRQVLVKLVKMFKVNELFPFNELLLRVDRQLCNETINRGLANLCAKALFALGGDDSEQLNRKEMPLLFGIFPAGGAFLQLNHYIQVATSGYFRKYDLGTVSNMVRYKSIIPPPYDLKQITAPVALYHAQNDFLASIKDVEILTLKLPNVVYKKLLWYKKFSHLDFILAKDVVQLLYDDVLKFMQKYIKN